MHSSVAASRRPRAPLSPKEPLAPSKGRMANPPRTKEHHNHSLISSTHAQPTSSPQAKRRLRTETPSPSASAAALSSSPRARAPRTHNNTALWRKGLPPALPSRTTNGPEHQRAKHGGLSFAHRRRAPRTAAARLEKGNEQKGTSRNRSTRPLCRRCPPSPTRTHTQRRPVKKNPINAAASPSPEKTPLPPLFLSQPPGFILHPYALGTPYLKLRVRG